MMKEEGGWKVLRFLYHEHMKNTGGPLDTGDTVPDWYNKQNRAKIVLSVAVQP